MECGESFRLMCMSCPMRVRSRVDIIYAMRQPTLVDKTQWRIHFVGPCQACRVPRCNCHPTSWRLRSSFGRIYPPMPAAFSSRMVRFATLNLGISKRHADLSRSDFATGCFAVCWKYLWNEQFPLTSDESEAG
jgi:hypothetical protein